MGNFQYNENGDLVVTPSASSSEKDFDFLLGNHIVHHKKLKSRLTNSNDWFEFDGTHEMHSILQQTGNLETHKLKNFDGTDYEGMAMRLFDPATRLWSIYWADSRSASVDVPVVGSFENNIGHFYAKDKDILLQFKWDATDPYKPVWSQAFSADNGKTWEWNWFMYFEKEISVLEIRNYLIKPGKRDAFINYFEDNFIEAQNKLGGYVLGQFRVKNAEDNFCWFRGYTDMASRSKYLPAFYYSDYWKQRRPVANSMLLNNDNVYLLKPLEPGKSIPCSKFRNGKDLVVVDLYTANGKLDKLINVFFKKYGPVLQSADYTAWVSELTENDFPALPVFQDRNLFVTITFYKNESEYIEKAKQMDQLTDDELHDIITIKNTWILYPTERSK